MKNRTRCAANNSASLAKILMSIAILSNGFSAANAAEPAANKQPAQSVSVKMGYFNLILVKAAFPESAASTALEEKAKEMLRRAVEDANKQLTDMQTANKPKDEIEKKKDQLQIEISAKQQALMQLLSANAAEANRAIAGAVGNVAKEKGLDVVIDGAGIFAGGEKFISSGEDVTDAIIKKLNPSISVH